MSKGLERIRERLFGLGVMGRGLWRRSEGTLPVPTYKRDEGAVDCGGFGASVAHD